MNDEIDPPLLEIERVFVNVKGREEHEAIIKDAIKCEGLGLDQIYETIVYPKK